MSEKPLARTAGVVAEKLDDGLVIYDDTTKQAHVLNQSAARVWSLADGRRTLCELAQKAELDEQRTAAAVDELAAAGLLVGRPGVSRRAVLRRAAVVGAGAVTAAPLIDTVLIPTAAAHASNVQTGGNGGGGGQLGPPVAIDDSYTTAAGKALTVPAPGVLANDLSPSGAPLTAILTSGPAHATLSFNANGSFTYTPATGFSGTDSFTYQASDGTQTSNTATVTITVNPPLRPVANNDSYTTAAGTALTVPAPGVLGNDVSPSGAPLTASLTSGPAHGSLSLNANGSFTYAPLSGFSGADSFTYQASDGTQTSNTATVTITVT